MHTDHPADQLPSVNFSLRIHVSVCSQKHGDQLQFQQKDRLTVLQEGLLFELICQEELSLLKIWPSRNHPPAFSAILLILNKLATTMIKRMH